VRLKISAKSKKSFTLLFCHAVFQAELFKPAEFHKNNPVHAELKPDCHKNAEISMGRFRVLRKKGDNAIGVPTFT
jgi:hypothetical protein